MNEGDREAPADGTGAAADATPAPPTEPAPALPTDATPVQPTATLAAPVVAWAAAAEPPRLSDIGQYAGGPPPFTVGALLSDTFARYGADPIRLLLVAIIASVINLAGTYASFTSNVLLGGSGDRASAEVSGLLGVLGFLVGIVAGAVTYALFEGGRRVPFLRVLRRGIERSVWLFVTALLIGLAFLGLTLLAFIPGIIIAAASPAIFAVLAIVAVLIGVWIAIRLSLAIPATVVDDIPGLDALKLSWRITKPAGVWLRILGASLALGLLLAPAALGGAILLLPALLNHQLPLLLVVALILAVITPLEALPLYAAYRRLVPPISPSWTTRAAPDATAPVVVVDAPPPATATATAPDDTSATEAPLVQWGDPAATPEATPAATQVGVSTAAQGFVVPRFGTGAMALVGLLVICSVGGLVAVPVVVGDLVAGRIELPRFPGFPGSPGFPFSSGFPGLDGEITPGTVAFGTSSDLSTCTVQGQTTFLRAGGQLVWIAAFTRRTTVSDQVRLRIIVDGTEVTNDLQNPGSFDCLGTEEPEIDIGPGIYVFEVLVNGRVDASGTLVVT